MNTSASPLSDRIGLRAPLAFAGPETSSRVADAFAQIPGLAAYSGEGMAFKNPTVVYAASAGAGLDALDRQFQRDVQPAPLEFAAAAMPSANETTNHPRCMRVPPAGRADGRRVAGIMPEAHRARHANARRSFPKSGECRGTGEFNRAGGRRALELPRAARVTR